MRLHTNSLESLNTAELTRDLPGVVLSYSRHGSRSHRYAYELTLTGTHYLRSPRVEGCTTATWDEWGTVIARILALDTAAIFGTVKRPIYAGYGDFHAKTDSRFTECELPADTHRQHNWEYRSPREFACKKCSAWKVN